MSIRSRLLALPMPGFLRKTCITRLVNLTAGAFGVTSPRGCGLRRYAAFTAEQAMRATDREADKLFRDANKLGSRLRARLGIRRTDEALAVMRYMYRLIGIDFCGTSGAFVIERCGFSSTYTPQICRLISSLDAGFLFGLTAGKKMSFTQRITEGAPFCKGVLE